MKGFRFGLLGINTPRPCFGPDRWDDLKFDRDCLCNAQNFLLAPRRRRLAVAQKYLESDPGQGRLHRRKQRRAGAKPDRAGIGRARRGQFRRPLHRNALIDKAAPPEEVACGPQNPSHPRPCPLPLLASTWLGQAHFDDLSGPLCFYWGPLQ